MERYRRVVPETSRTFQKVFFGEVMTEINNWPRRTKYMDTLQDDTFDVNMTSSKFVRIRHHIRRFLRRYLVLKIKPNTGQTPGTTDKIERRKNISKCEGRDLLTIETLKTYYCCIESPLCGMNPTHSVTKL